MKATVHSTSSIKIGTICPSVITTEGIACTDLLKVDVLSVCAESGVSETSYPERFGVPKDLRKASKDSGIYQLQRNFP